MIKAVKKEKGFTKGESSARKERKAVGGKVRQSKRRRNFYDPFSVRDRETDRNSFDHGYRCAAWTAVCGLGEDFCQCGFLPH